MRRSFTRWTPPVLVALAGLGMQGFAGVTAQSQSAAGEAFGVFASTPTGSQAKTPLATVPVGGGMGDADAVSAGLASIVEAKNLVSIATGAGIPEDISAEASSTAEQITILSGLISAEAVVALSSSALHGTTSDASSAGSQFVGLTVNGVAMSATPAPNTRVDLPGVGYVILNEQRRFGDGVNSIGLTVTMIHVVLEETVLDLLGGTTTVQTGEIIVGSATSRVSR